MTHRSTFRCIFWSWLANLLISIVGADSTHTIVQERFTVTAPAHFSEFNRYDKSQSLLLTIGGEHVRIPWRSEYEDEVYYWYSFTLTPDEEYTFTILLEKVLAAPDKTSEQDTDGTTIWSSPSALMYDLHLPMIIRVLQDDTVIYDASICEVHQTLMDYREVPIYYGLPLFDETEPDWETRKRLFPHESDYILGGCIVQLRKSDWVHICPECVAAYQEWKNSPHPKPNRRKK